jgi:predicted metal-binding membrane protein
MDAKCRVPTPNVDMIYAMSFLPGSHAGRAAGGAGAARVLGMLCDFWQRPLTDVGLVGPDQFTPLKARCLRHCRSPLGFLLHLGNFRGRLRDVRVGIYHGGYCVGCCWSLMLVLVAAGVMNMAWMVALTAVVFAEKIWRSGQAFGYAIGALMIIAALLLPWLPPVQTALLG